MNIKKIWFRQGLSLLLAVTICLAHFPVFAKLPPISLSRMYALASQGNVKGLRYAIQRGLDIDALDKNRNTALCHAINQRNYRAYNTLRAAGANPRHPCTQTIPAESYASFMNSGRAVPIGQTPIEVYHGYGRGEFAISRNTWLLGGVAVAAYLLFGNKGGGGHKRAVGGVKKSTGKSLGDEVGITEPNGPAVGYMGKIVHDITNGGTYTNVNGYNGTYIDNDSSVNGTRLVELINFNDSILNNYAQYLSVFLKASQNSTIGNGDTATATQINLGNNMVGMAAVDNSTANNDGVLDIKAQNGSFGMTASRESTAANNKTINLALTDQTQGGTHASLTTANNQISAMYADTHSTATNNGTITGSGAINGRLIGMQARFINEEKEPVPTTTTNIVNSDTGAINMTLDIADGSTLATNMVGMGSYADKAFLDGKYKISRAGYASVDNYGTINMTLTTAGTGAYTANATNGDQGIIGMRSDINTTATNHKTIIMNVSGAHAGMLSVHGGKIINQGSITLSGKEGYGMLAVKGAGVNTEINMLEPYVYNAATGTITVNSDSGYGMASLFKGTLANDGNIILNNALAIGMYSDTGEARNAGNITVNNASARGMQTSSGTVINTEAGIIDVQNGVALDTMGSMGKAQNLGTINVYNRAWGLISNIGSSTNDGAINLYGDGSRGMEVTGTGTATNNLQINVLGEDAFGLYAGGTGTSTATVTNAATGIIDVTGAGSAGILAAAGNGNNDGTVNAADATAGMRLTGAGKLTNNNIITLAGASIGIEVMDAATGSAVNSSTGVITTTNSSGAYGIFIEDNSTDGANLKTATNDGIIRVDVSGGGLVVNMTGMYAHRGNIINNNMIDLTGAMVNSTGILIGTGEAGVMGKATNKGTIKNALIAMEGVSATNGTPGTIYTTLENSGTISFDADADGDVYGIKGSGLGVDIINKGSIDVSGSDTYSTYGIARAGSYGSITNTGSISVTTEAGTIGSNSGINVSGSTDPTATNKVTNSGVITIHGNANGIVYTMGGNSVGNVITNEGNITVNGDGNAIVYTGNSNLDITKNTIDNSGNIIINGNGNGINVSGTGNTVANSKIITVNGSGTGIVSTGNNIITNTGTITAGENGTGIYLSGTGNFSNINITNNGTINVGTGGKGIDIAGTIFRVTNTKNINVNGTGGYGIYSSGSHNIANSGTITVGAEGTGIYLTGNGISVQDNFTNSGTINVGTEGKGIYVSGTNFQVINAQNINVAADDDVDTDNDGTIDDDGKTGYGIYVDGDNNTVRNNGTITIGEGGKGIYASGTNTSVRNIGSIIVAGDPMTLTNCPSGNTGCDPWIILANGASFTNNAQTRMIGFSLDFNTLSANGGTFEVGKGGSYEADEISGTVYASSDIVTEGNEREYVNENSFVGEDTGIELKSGSAMFDAKLVNHEDGSSSVVMTMKDFDELYDDAKIAEYLNANYAMGNGSELFASLKSANNLQLLGQVTLNSLGLDFVPNFAKQNMDLMKSLNLRINAEMFDNASKDDVRVMAGYDNFYRDQDGTKVFTGYEDKANSIFGIWDKRYNDNFRYGVGLAVTQFHSKYDNKSSRDEVIIQALAPLTYEFDEDIRLVSTPRVGYGFGDYHRRVGLEYHKADTKNYYYGITNELRKAFDAGFMKIEPTVEFNMLGMYQDSMKEKNGIQVDSSNNFSAETGFGLYAKKEFAFQSNKKIKIRAGGTYYHEMANPYQASKAKMSGMAGSYHMESYDIDRDRAVVSIRADYEQDLFNMYMQVNKYIEKKDAYSYDLGLGYKF